MAKALSQIQGLEDLPWDLLPRSLRVDVLQLVSQARPAIRSHIKAPAERHALRDWTAGAGMDFAEDGPWVCITSQPESPHRILCVDASQSPHVYQLGQLLGYPDCCCEVASVVGEAGLDELAKRQSLWNLSSGFKCIDSTRYTDGIAFISHIPCGRICNYSRISRANRRAVRALAQPVSDREPFRTWQRSLELLC